MFKNAIPKYHDDTHTLTIQSASLCLTTTPAEEMALGLKFWLAPLRVVRAPVDEICMTLLLSLRFMSVVFDELRNLSLGLAARSVPWKQLPPGAGLQVRMNARAHDQYRLSHGLLGFGSTVQALHLAAWGKRPFHARRQCTGHGLLLWVAATSRLTAEECKCLAKADPVIDC